MIFKRIKTPMDSTMKNQTVGHVSILSTQDYNDIQKTISESSESIKEFRLAFDKLVKEINDGEKVNRIVLDTISSVRNKNCKISIDKFTTELYGSLGLPDTLLTNNQIPTDDKATDTPEKNKDNHFSKDDTEYIRELVRDEVGSILGVNNPARSDSGYNNYTTGTMLLSNELKSNVARNDSDTDLFLLGVKIDNDGIVSISPKNKFTYYTLDRMRSLDGVDQLSRIMSGILPRNYKLGKIILETATDKNKNPIFNNEQTNDDKIISLAVTNSDERLSLQANNKYTAGLFMEDRINNDLIRMLCKCPYEKIRSISVQYK